MNPTRLLCSLFPAALLSLGPSASRADEPTPAAASAPSSAPPTTLPIFEATPREAPPLAGWHGGVFFLRDENDNFRLYVQGRGQVDAFGYFGPGVPDSKLKGTVLLRRVRVEVGGEFLQNWQWMLAGDWGANAVDNANGKNMATATAFADAQTASVRAAPTDLWVNYRGAKWFNVQVGQYDAPFTMANRTSDKYLSFMERPLAVRALGIPTNKELGAMVWGETGKRELFYSVGVFNGDGQNRPNLDDQADVIGRVFTHPIGDGPLKDFQVGASFRYGSRNPNYVYYDYPAMTTQGNYRFWAPRYGTTRILPSGQQRGLAAEFRLPIGAFDLTSEVVYVKNDTREAIDGFENAYTQRKGDMSGLGYYVEVGFWPLGNRDINGLPGYENPTHLDFKKKNPESPPQALQLLVKWEQVQTTYSSASRARSVNPGANLDGDTKINAFSLGMNYWATKHVRLSLNYVLNMFPDSTNSAKQTAAQRAVAPGNTLDAGVNDDARANAHVLHEVMGRVGIAF
ncbi:MAG TPA: porin [Polyangiaceae bacterium]|nr:porin [Polyangiaceae bacterium]